MFDRPQAPAFLIKHPIVHDTANGQLRVFLDRVVFQVFVTAVAINEELPVRIALANSTAERQSHRGRLDIERLVVLHNADRFERIERRGGRFNWFEEKSETKSVEKCFRLIEVWSAGRR